MPRATKARALERYRELPLPDTTQEAWRFTDLSGFDPDAFGGSSNGHGPVSDTGTMLDIDVAGLAHVSEGSIEIVRAPDGVTFEPLGDHERLGTLVGADDKFTAHNAASWEHGLLVRVPKGVVLKQPLYPFHEHVIPRLALLLFVLMSPAQADRFSVDALLARRRPGRPPL